jgi:hypothetical protein
MNNAAAIWSAVAASFAAFSAFMTMLIHRRNLLDAARPEILLVDWSREDRGTGDGKHEVIKFRRIRNIGRGLAYNIYMNCLHERDRFPLACMSTMRIPLLAAGEEIEANGEIVLWWKNVEESDLPNMGLGIQIFAWDAREIRHETTYKLFVVPAVYSNSLAMDCLAPGLALTQRQTVSRAVWRLKLEILAQMGTVRQGMEGMADAPSTACGTRTQARRRGSRDEIDHPQLSSEVFVDL